MSALPNFECLNARLLTKEETGESKELVEDYVRRPHQNARRDSLKDKSGRWSLCNLTIEATFNIDMLRRLDFSLKCA